MIKKTNKQAKLKTSSSHKYTYLAGLIAILALGYGAFKAFTPKPLDINAVYSGGVPSVKILGNDVYTTEGKWVPPGTYAGVPCPSMEPGTPNDCQTGRNISGQFFTWGTYGTFVPPVMKDSAPKADIPAVATNPNDPSCKDGYRRAPRSKDQKPNQTGESEYEFYLKCYTIDLNKDGRVNNEDKKIFEIIYEGKSRGGNY